MPTESRSTTASFAQRRSWTSSVDVYTVSAKIRSESITGYRGPRIHQSNPCTHTKTAIQHIPFTARFPNAGYTLSGIYPTNASGPTRPYVNSTVSVKLSRAECASLLDELAGDIPPVVSVPNMLLELPQTLNLWNDLKDPLLALLRDRGVRKRWRNGSNALLSQQFGLFPLISDIQALIQSKRTVHTELARLTREQKSSSPFKKGIRLDSVDGSITLYSGGNTMRWSSVTKSVEAQIYGVRRTRRYLDCSDPAVVKAMARALYGWNRPLDTLWEATPFSFVADWFFPVGDYLHGLNQSVFANRFEIENLGWTAKARMTGTLETRFTTAYDDPIWAPTAEVVSSAFARGSGLPVSTFMGDLTIPGVKQAILGASLVLQKGA